MGHVLARLAGHGLVLMPHWPYAFERDGDAVRVTRWTAAGPAQVLIRPGRLADGGDVVDVSGGPREAHWSIETTTFRVRWPDHFRLESSDEGDGTPFYLHGPRDAAVFPQGPVPAEQIAGPDALVTAGQTVLARRRAFDAIELGYQHDGESWWQGHWKVPFGPGRVLVFTAQSPVRLSMPTRAAAEMLAETFELTR
jgi:hypothetical protein